MGTPIMVCRFRRAMTDPEEFDSLVRDMAYNVTHKYFNVNECNHTPVCPPLTKEEDVQIKTRLMAAVKKAHSEPNAAWLY